MSASARKFSLGVSRRSTLWLTLSLLLAVLVPSGCLLWFMNRALVNEELAMRQRLAEAYRGHLEFVQSLLATHWQQQAETLESQAAENAPAATFARFVRAERADAAIICDTNGHAVYPDRNTAAHSEPGEPAWATARGLENSDLAAAAQAYAKLAATAPQIGLAAQALQAQARCLVQAGQREAAAAVLTGPLAESRFQSATDSDGRLIVPNAELMAVELLQSSQPDRAISFVEALNRKLNDYDRPMPAAQRRFLMRELQRLSGKDQLFPTLAAEDLAARYLESDPLSFQEPGIRGTRLPEVWQLTSSRGRIVLLFRTASLQEQLRRALPQASDPKVRVDFTTRGLETDRALLSLAAGPALPGWQLTLSLTDREQHEAGAKRRARLYVWVSGFVITLVVILAVLAIGMIRRQAALTQLRNDLVANVTHELKTPLASTRLLVETLLNSEKLEEKTVREYLELIARENLRLSRLIDNFLTFSRIERNKYTFEFKTVPAATLAESAATAVRERFSTPDCTLGLSIPTDLPEVQADADAMVTALLNLLDNAYKYSGETKRIEFTANAANGSVTFSVRDNGIGLSASDAKRVFHRFYQVNEHLSRSSGGAGLGLSIVQFIVSAHQGTVGVESELNRGSTFTISVPALRSGTTRNVQV